MIVAAPGDVVCVRNPKGWPARLIRLGAALLDKPASVNHVIVVSHTDPAGTLWGVEARPGGVGWVDMAQALRGPYSLSNTLQPKTQKQRAAIATVVAGMLGTAYDWNAIVGDAMDAVHAENLWAQHWDGKVPAHVVCSSLASWAYSEVGLPSPTRNRNCTPADWADFIITQDWR